MPEVRGDVLVVDDDVKACEVIAQLLQRHGHTVRMCNHGLEALALARHRPPELVLLDVHLPDIDGFEVCRRLRAQWSAGEMPVLFFSATREEEEKVRAFRLGGVDFVTKPCPFGELLARVETHLELRRVQRQAAERAKELEEVNAYLKTLEEARTSFVSEVVHDLKNPLTPVLKNAEWLLSQSRGDEESDDVLRDLYLAAQQMNRMVLSLLDVARGPGAKLTPRVERLRLAPWLDEVVALARLHVRERPSRLILQAEDGEVQVDRMLMTRVLQNLLDNALKYAPEDSAIVVRAAPRPGGGLWALVEDAGPGIPHWAREAIFEPWTRLERKEDRHARSSYGLGLSFCRRAVEAHGGRLRLEDVVPHGSRFVLEVPPPGARTREEGGRAATVEGLLVRGPGPGGTAVAGRRWEE